MIFTGIQPSGIVTLGNYLGAIKNWQREKSSTENLYCIVNLHALTSNIDAKELQKNTEFLAALYIAAGLTKKGNIFIQSEVKEHTELAWILQCNIGLGELERMTQFKDKSSSQQRPNAGLLTYPVLMAADILLYDTTEVPVGEDQKQHLELTRNIAEKMNKKMEQEIFVLPNPKINKIGAKIYSLTDPLQKMSKSNPNPKSYISIMDTPESIIKKIKSAVTDSKGEINLDKENQPGVYNLLQIYASIKNLSIQESLEYFKEENYGYLKEEVANAVVEDIIPLQNKIKKILEDKELIKRELQKGKEYAQKIASQKMIEVNQKIGLI